MPEPLPPQAHSITDPAVPPTPEQCQREQLARDQKQLLQLLPISSIALTPSEQEEIQRTHTANLVLGPAASAPMICDEKCPVRWTCPLFSAGKHPVGKPCPFEQQEVASIFLGFVEEMGKTLPTLLESERSYLSTLTGLTLKERRCTRILSYAENAALTEISVRDVDAETGQPIAWEKIIHTNEQALQAIVTQRRMLLKDLELTPEAKTKKQKMLNKGSKEQEGHGHGMRWSQTNDKIRGVMNAPKVVDLS